MTRTVHDTARTGFFGSALLMMGGTAIAQLVPILIAPVLTRLYSPTEYGVLATFVGIATVLGVVATLRFEPAIVLPAQDSEAANVAALALLVATVLTALLFVIALFNRDLVTQRWPALGGSLWLILLPALVLAIAITQTAASWSNRKRRYGALASGMVLQQGGTATVSLVSGLAGATQSGLIVGRLFGQLLSAGWLLIAVWSDWRARVRDISWVGMRSALSRYRQFPQFNLPYSLIGSASREFLVFAMTVFHFTQHAGYYGLSRSVLYAPVSFLSASLSQVFYREAADSIGTPRFEALVERLMKSIAFVFTPAFVVLAFWGPDLFGLVFGEQWREAGVYAAVFAPAAYLFLFSSWPERLFEVTGRQRVSLAVQVSFDTVSVLLVLFLLGFGHGPLAALVAFTTVSCGYHCAYISAAFRVAGLPAAILARVAGLACSIGAVVAVLAWGGRLLGPSTGLVAAVIFTALYSIAAILWLLRRHRNHAEAIEQESLE